MGGNEPEETFEEDIEHELFEALEAGKATEEQLSAACAKAASISNDDMLWADVFQGDESDVVVMSRKVVRGRSEHVDHYSRRTIPAGARQLVLREVLEGEFITTRHSELSIWMLMEGFDPSGLAPTSGTVTPAERKD